ncbi:Crp/Fnr family transcriptional regulator [Limibacter armeniacum]|uniref:Crp/Fnr family transcriptional regulator n=1 Tax=Limibacter armeniacum TaxID=466084 RepID=UPI002FE6BF36
MEKLKEAILKHHHIEQDILDDFVQYWEVVDFSKNAIISEQGKTDNYLYFTVSGCQKAYYLNNGKESIISFTQPNHFTCAPESFLTQKPSKYYFQCIHDSSFYRISYQHFKRQVDKHVALQYFLTNSLMGLVNNITDRFIKQATYSISMKFVDFMHEHGNLINHIPQKDIANFLNINPTNFSKLINSVKVE